MIRTCFFQYEDQRKRAAKLAKQLKISVAELMRRAIDELIAKHSK